jgi:hypothetical protein
MDRSRIARRFAAAALAIHAGLALTVWGTAGAGADEAGSCDGVTGELVDHGTTVTGVFDVPSTCDKVSVLSWFAAGPHGEYPQEFLDRIGHENVAPGHYEWTITAPPPECFRQLDLRVPNRNVDSIVGGERLCEESTTTTTPTTTSPTTTSPSTPTTSTPTTSTPTTTTPTTTTPTTTSPSTTVAPPVTTSPPTTSPTTTSPSTTIASSVTITTPTTAGPTGSTTSTVVVGGVVLTPPSPAAQGELPRTGRSLAEVVGIALIGVGLGLGLLTAQEWQRQTRAG